MADTFNPEFDPEFDPEKDGWTEDEVDALAGQIGAAFEELDPEDQESLLRKHVQDDVNDNLDEWKLVYGFEHECSCAEEAANGEFTEITRCYAGACEQAFQELRRVREFLFAIATSPIQNVDTIKAMAEEAFRG